MKETITLTREFDLPDEEYEYVQFKNSPEKCREYLNALENIKEYIRAKLKWADVSEETEKILEEIRQIIPFLD